MSPPEGGAGRGPLVRRLLARLLPRDDWSEEFLAELDAEAAWAAPSGRGARAELWWILRLTSPRTLHFLWLVRRRAATHGHGAATRQSGAEAPLRDSLADLRHALRGFAREPRFAASVVVTLGLALGANAAMLGVADTLFLSGPAHVRAHDEIVRVFLRIPRADVAPEPAARPSGPVTSSGSTARQEVRHTPWIPYRTASAIHDAAPGFRGVTVYRLAELVTRVGDDIRLRNVSEVDGSYFDVLGVVPALGRFFGPDAAAGAAAPAVVSHALWRASLGGVAGAVGRTILVAGTSHTVVAVAPEGFAGPHLEEIDVWVPADGARAGSRNWHVLARAPDADASARTSLARGADAVHLRTDPGRFFQWALEGEITLAPLRVDDSGTASAESEVARLLLAVVSLVLLIAAANVVNLLLARLTRRRGEVVVRLALGISRWRLSRWLLSESVALALLGGVAALPVAYLAGGALRGVLLPDVAWTETPVDAGLLAATGGAALLIGLVVGWLPARLAGRTDLTAGLAAERVGGEQGRGRVHVALATAQVTLSAALLVCAGLFAKSFWTMRVTDLGIAADRTYVVALGSLDRQGLRHGSDSEREAYERALATARADFPASALAIGVPFRATFGSSVHVPGLDSIPELPGGGPYTSGVTGRYFDAVGTPLLRGRAISDDDVARGDRVMVVSESMERTLWPAVGALGQCVRIGDGSGPCFTVVGIAADVHRFGYREPASMQYYVPMGLQGGFSGTELVVHGEGRRDAAQRLGGALEAVSPGVDYVEVVPLRTQLADEIRPWRLGAVVLSLAAALALVVSLIGVYGVLSYAVAQRRREIGVRIALGASHDSIRGLILRSGLASGGVGVLAGIAAVLAASRWIEPLLYETAVADPWVLGVVATTLMTAAALACLLPATRAARTDPVATLRGEG